MTSEIDILEMGDGEPLRDAVARWNGSYALQLNADEIDFIRTLRDISLHFKAGRAERRLRESRAALGFDQDRSRERKFGTACKDYCARPREPIFLPAWARHTRRRTDLRDLGSESTSWPQAGQIRRVYVQKADGHTRREMGQNGQLAGEDEMSATTKAVDVHRGPLGFRMARSMGFP